MEAPGDLGIGACREAGEVVGEGAEETTWVVVSIGVSRAV